MTKDELIARLKELHDHNDEEVAHGIADDLPLEFINDNDVTEAFIDVPKWYS